MTLQEFLDHCKKNDVNRWSEPLPNLRWVTESEFARSHFFMYSGYVQFGADFGGPNESDNHAQVPPGYSNPAHKAHAQCWVDNGGKGFVMVSEYYHPIDPKRPYPHGESVGRVWFGLFAFCEHKNVTQRNLGRCWNEYTCRNCGHSWEIDSSD